jgi:glucan endo-1,3-alpha-glucosidase
MRMTAKKGLNESRISRPCFDRPQAGVPIYRSLGRNLVRAQCGCRRLKSSASILALFLFLLLTGPGLRAAGSTNHFVFAHYMVCFADYGDSLAGFKQDILDAQAAGVDGFALNCGEWNSPGADWYYTNRVATLYQAAAQLGTGFKFFFSVDESNTNDIVAMISAYANNTNSFRYQGKLVVSTSGQNTVDWQNSVFKPLTNMGINVFFVPYFSPSQMNSNGVASLITTYSNILDGLFYFAAGTVPTITNNNEAYSQACQGAGKVFMAGYSPTYWGCAWPNYTGRPYYETQGGAGTMTEWMWIIANQPNWVELTTWNDFNESTYSSPVNDPEQYENELLVPHRYSHAGYLALSKYYITWYKTGQQPPINQDSLFYFYRTHSTNAVASATNDYPVTLFPNNGPVQDVIYTTAFLTSPAQLVIASGNTLTTNVLPAGISSQQTPFAPGVQTFTLQRTGVQVLSVQGPNVLAQITNYDYFTTSGDAYGLSAPNHLQASP